jgi:hypothetical protein
LYATSKIPFIVNGKVLEFQILATVSTDDPSSDPVLNIIVLEGHYETTVSLSMQSMNLLISENTA